MFDKLPSYVRPTIFLSAVFGLFCGLLLVIPFIQFFMFFIFWLVGGLIVYLLRRNNFIGQFTQKEGIVIGCVSGMVSVVAASISFIPLSMIVGAIFKTVSVSFLFTTSFSSSLFSLFVLIMFVFFIGLMNMIFNIASALAVIAIFNNLIQDQKEETEFKIEL